MTLKFIRNTALILALVVISVGVGYNYGKKSGFSYSLPSSNIIATQSSNQAAQKGLDFNLFWTVWDKLKENYYDKTKLDAKNMYYGAVSGMVAAIGDPYTVFLTPKQNQDTKEELSGTFDGIGAQLGYKEKKIVVIAPLKDTPAEKAGILAGDWILKIDTKDTSSLTLPEAVSLIRGKKGTKVKLTILHENKDKPEELEIVRDSILVKSVTVEYKNNIAVLKLSQFGDNSTLEWDRAVNEIVAKGSDIKGVVLDLRNNPGGYLTGSVYIASEFLRNGDVVIQEDGNGLKHNYAVNRKGKILDKPLVVIVNKGSASASEIVAGALQDRSRAKLVGEMSFGKGTIQDAQDLDDGAGLHVTVAKWLTPKGKWINGTGLAVDYKVEMDENNQTKDPQLEKAIELLN
jgi:carboxyl-terminal processing protease